MLKKPAGILQVFLCNGYRGNGREGQSGRN
jgi:hypothetical protein